MAVTIPARNEQHGHRRNSRHEKGVMVRTTGHTQKTKTVLLTSLRQSRYDRGLTLGWRIRIEQFRVNCDLTPGGSCAAGFLEGPHYFVAPLKVGVANINAQSGFGGNAIHSAWKHVTHSYGRHGVECSASSRRIFDG